MTILKKGKSPNHRITKQERVHLTMPVARIEKAVRRYVSSGDHVSDSASVAMTAAVEYLVQDLLESAGNIALDKKKQNIKPTMIYEAIQADPVLERVYANHLIVDGGCRKTYKVRQAVAVPSE